MIWVWLVIVAILSAWLQLVIHELSHVVVGKIRCGHTPIKIVPWPSRSGGRWYFARWEYLVGDRKDPLCLTELSPVLAGVLEILIVLIVGLFVGWTMRLFLLPLGVTALIDIAWWWRGYLWGSSYCDGKRFRSCCNDILAANDKIVLDAGKISQSSSEEEKG
jgi:hypothetical protein